METGPVRKKCVECGEPIVGVIPKWKNGEPVCRNCTFNVSKSKPPTPSREVKDNGKPVQRRTAVSGGRGKLFLWAFAFLLAVGMLVSVPLLSSGILKDKPLRKGGVGTDRLGDDCVRNLWTLSKALQDKRFTGMTLSCPASGRPYTVNQEGDDTIISCPNPETHNLSTLQVSRHNPFPVAAR